MRGKKQQSIEQQTLLSHVRELQIRLLVTGVVLVGAGVFAYLYYAQILDLLRAPLNAPLYYNSVSGSFAFVMKICMVAGIAVSVPLIVYNFIMFVRPAFIEVFTRKRVFLMTIGSVVAAAAGAVFGFTFVIPGALRFFSGFQVNGLNELISADSYLNFVINTLITFILIFQLPIIVSLIDRIKPISPRAMIKGEKWALLGSLIISFVVPFAMDFMTQLLIAAPIFILYNLSFVVVVFQHSYTRKVQKTVAKKETKTIQRAQKLANKPVRRGGKLVPVPVVAVQPLAPHPQLAEVFALQERQPAVNAKSLHAHVKPASRPVHHPAALAPKPMQPVATQQLRPQPMVRTVDGMMRPALPKPVAAAPIRTQPTSVIRQAGTIRAPQRSMDIYRPMRQSGLLSDIR